MRRVFAVKVDVAGEVFRFATDRVDVTEEIGGETYVIPYIPYIVSFSPVKSAITIDGNKPPIPNTNITVWDGYSELRDAFENLEYEGADCTVYFIDVETGAQKDFSGYLTNFKHSKGQASFNVRQEEDKGSESFLKQFKHDSFENFFIGTPGRLAVEAQWSIYEDTPWTVDYVFLHRSELSRPYKVGDSFMYIKSTKSHPNGHPTDRNLLIRRNYSDDVLNVELTFSGATVTRASGDWTTPRDGGTGYQIGDVVEIENTQSVTNDGRYTVAGVSASVLTLDDAFSGNAASFVAETITGVTMYFYDDFELVDSTSNLDYFWIDFPAEDRTGVREAIRQAASPHTIVNDGKEIRIPVETIVPTLRADFDHPKGAIVYMTRASGDLGDEQKKNAGMDRIVVNANGRVPPSSVDSSNNVGFVYAGQTSKNAVTGKIFREFHRFQWAGVDADRDLLPEGDPILREFGDGQVFLELDIHNNARSWQKQIFAIRRKDTQIPINEFEAGTSVQLADFTWTIAYMDMIVDNLDQDTRDKIDVVDFINRVKGNRVDMLNSFADLKHTLLTAANDPNAVISETHSKLLNNATGQFGVVLESELIEDTDTRTIYERMLFAVNNRAGVEIADPTVDDETEDAGFEFVEPSPGNDQNFSNFFKYSDGLFDRASQTEENPTGFGENGLLGEDDAEEFFLSKKYRIVLDPVPENSKDLGKFFPIVYGLAERVPMLHVISKKVLKEDVLTAGDDTYIYCSHPCDVRDPLDIRIELLDEPTKEGRSQTDEEDKLPLVVDEFVESPFPMVATNHSAIDEDASGNEERRNVTFLYHPYHNIKIVETLDGFRLNAVQLRGEEWDPRLGKSDKRYPIRNGVGSSTLYATFGGWVDDTGEFTGAAGSMIVHPIDIVNHFVTKYGRYPFTDPERIFDANNLAKVRSLTRRLEASVFLNEDMTISDFIQKISKEFGLLSYLKDGKIKFALGDVSVVDNTKLISEGFNLLNGVQEVDKGAGKVYTRVLFNYRKNHVTGEYDATIDLNKTNNLYCARAAKALGGKLEFKIDSDFIRSASVANDVANRIAARVAAHQVEYKVEVKYTGIDFEPGDVVPVTYSPLGFSNQTMLIKSVVEDRDIIKMELIRFI